MSLKTLIQQLWNGHIWESKSVWILGIQDTCVVAEPVAPFKGILYFYSEVTAAKRGLFSIESRS